MSAENSYQQQNDLGVDIVDVVKKKVKESREEVSTEVIDTLFYVAMKACDEFFVITEEYNIAEHSFSCEIYEDGSNLETILSNIFQKVKSRHQETYKIKSLFEDGLKETMHQPIQYIRGYVVQKGSNISSFTIFSPRETTRFDWIKNGMFGKREVEVKVSKRSDEIELENYYYQFSAFKDNLNVKEAENAKRMIVKSTQRKFNLSDEMFAYQRCEKMWNDFLKAGSIPVRQFEEYIQGIYQFKETCSAEIKPLVEDLYQGIFKKKSVLNQYDLMAKQHIEGLIYID